MPNLLDKLKSRADEINTARLHQDIARAERQRPKPAVGVEDGVPSISLDAAYVGTIAPEDVRRDSISVRTIGPDEAKRSTPLSEAQLEGARVAAALALGIGAPEAPVYGRQSITGGR